MLSSVKMIKVGLEQMGFAVRGGQTPILPVIIGDAQKAVLLADGLKEKGLFA